LKSCQLATGRWCLVFYNCVVLIHRDDSVGLQDQLGDAVTRTDDKGVAGVVVEEHHLELILVVRVDESSTNGDAVLHGQSNARLNATICSGWELHGHSGGDNNPLARQNDITIGGKQVIPRRPFRRVYWADCGGNELVDIEGHSSLFLIHSFN